MHFVEIQFVDFGSLFEFKDQIVIDRAGFELCGEAFGFDILIEFLF